MIPLRYEERRVAGGHNERELVEQAGAVPPTSERGARLSGRRGGPRGCHGREGTGQAGANEASPYKAMISRAHASLSIARWPLGWLVAHSSRFSRRLSSLSPLM